MDRETRNRIQRATQDARRLLDQEFGEQLEGTFDLRLDGAIASEPGSHLDARQRRIRERLVEAVAHRRAMGERAADAVDGFRREAAFTMLNRFVALKMLEARGLVQPCASEGQKSAGFREFSGLAPGLVELEDHGYRLYIESLFDEIGREVRVLFDRREPASLLWPRRAALDGLLGILNAPDLAGVWREDETIGWVYQYFNGEDERRQMRSESQAPRNSRELAVRNQFFTPRYVVEFLTDNTLGRTWYEMRHGETALRERCRYLVSRPNEVWLGIGEEPPAEEDGEGAAEEDLNHKPVHVRHRAKKDPRDLRVLDPACGSGHFLLYAFDLLLVMYEEAWDDAASPASEVTGRSLRQDYPTMDGLRPALPGLVLRHNLWGIDIDPRAAQIAALALWMRAQRAFNEFNVPRGTRDAIARANVVVAEPMPGEHELLRDFCATLDASVSSLVETVFDEMKLAGEAGSLLRIEDSVGAAIRRLAPSWGGMYAGQDERRWSDAESTVLRALHRYAEGAVNGKGFRRRMFSDDATQGLAFIDACRQMYDVVLMNPPFGTPMDTVIKYGAGYYSRAKNDFVSMFIESAAHRVHTDGCIGVIAKREPFFTASYARWRSEFYGTTVSPDILADLGWGVLDDASVEVMTQILRVRSGLHNDKIASFIRPSERPAEEWMEELASTQSLRSPHLVPYEALRRIPGLPLAHGAPEFILRAFHRYEPLSAVARTAQGLSTTDDFRFCRLRWEVPFDHLGSFGDENARTIPLAKGEPASPFYGDVPVVVRWARNGAEVKEYNRARYGAASRNITNEELYGFPAVVFPRRTRRFTPRLLPPGCAFSKGGQIARIENGSQMALLALLASSAADALLQPLLGRVHGDPQYEVGAIGAIPIPPGALELGNALMDEARTAWSCVRYLDACRETSSEFVLPALLVVRRPILSDCLTVWAERKAEIEATLNTAREAINSSVLQLYAGSAKDLTSSRNLPGESHPDRQHPIDAEDGDEPGVEDGLEPARLIGSLISWSIGCALGRFDVRFGTGEREADWTADPNSRVPVCSPSMLPSEVGGWGASGPPSYPIEVPADGILVDDPGHPRDMLARIDSVFAAVWGESAEPVLRESVQALDRGAPDLRTWLRKSFFDDHIKRYSKSRRKAPIYWRLGTPSGSYSVFAYYHRFTRDTLHRVLHDYAVPKLQHEERRLTELTQDGGPSPAASQRKAIAAQDAFVAELRAFRDELRRVAPLWNPDLDDGVILNFAPLWRLVGHTTSWQKECRQAWDKLATGEYDWAHIAMHLWPERVVPRCADDRSFAIAHGLEDVFWVERDEKWEPRSVTEDQVARLVAERSSKAVEAARDDLLRAPAPTGSGRGRRRSS